MFDVLVYLYENYWRRDACPSAEQLQRKLNAIGFDEGDVEEALLWLHGLSVAADATDQQTAPAQPQADSLRVYSASETAQVGHKGLGFIEFLCGAGVLNAPLRELVIDRAMAAAGGPIDLEQLKIIVLMVFWSSGIEPDALVLDELFVDESERVIH
jgi:Smg protein